LSDFSSSLSTQNSCRSHVWALLKVWGGLREKRG
jgi:hypothetical protein